MPEIVDFGGGTSPLAGGLNALSSFLGGYTQGTRQRKQDEAAAAEQQRLNQLRDLKISQLETMALEDEAADRLQAAMTGPMFQEEYLKMLGDFDTALFAGISNELELIPGQDFQSALTPEALRIFRDPNLSRDDRRRFMDILKGRQETALRNAEMGRVTSFSESMLRNEALVESVPGYAEQMEAIRLDEQLAPAQKHLAMKTATADAFRAVEKNIQRDGVIEAFQTLTSSQGNEWNMAFMSVDEFGEQALDQEAQDQFRDKVFEFVAKEDYASAIGMIRSLQDPNIRQFVLGLETQIKTAAEAQAEAERRLGMAVPDIISATGASIERAPEALEPPKTTYVGGMGADSLEDPSTGFGPVGPTGEQPPALETFGAPEAPPAADGTKATEEDYSEMERLLPFAQPYDGQAKALSRAIREFESGLEAGMPEGDLAKARLSLLKDGIDPDSVSGTEVWDDALAKTDIGREQGRVARDRAGITEEVLEELFEDEFFDRSYTGQRKGEILATLNELGTKEQVSQMLFTSFGRYRQAGKNIAGDARFGRVSDNEIALWAEAADSGVDFPIFADVMTLEQSMGGQTPPAAEGYGREGTIYVPGRGFMLYEGKDAWKYITKGDPDSKEMLRRYKEVLQSYE